jgi:dipeptidyl aminopeptidase/acylaminoacyl peptidase
MKAKDFGRVLSLSVVLLLALAATAPAQDGYKMPPKEIADLVDAPVTPYVLLNPDGDQILLMHRASLPSIAELAKPELRIAGLRIDPESNGPSRPRYNFNRLVIKPVSGGDEIEVTGLPPEPSIGNVSWSPDGEMIAFTVTTQDAVQLWVAQAANGKAQQVGGIRLNAVFYGSPYYWLPGGEAIVCLIVPDDRGPAPVAPRVPAGPVIKENIGKTAPAPTYQDLLKNKFDETLFEYYATAGVAIVASDGSIRKIGPEGIIANAEPSPDGNYLLVETIHKPFSYLVPFDSFPYRAEVWDMDGNIVKQVADLPLAEEVPIAFDAVPTGPRDFTWRQDSPATLVWVEAADNGDPAVEAEVRDRVYMLPAPFDGEPLHMIDLGLRYAGALWSEEGYALVYARWWKARRLHAWVVDTETAGAEPRLLWDRSSEDRYNDPGSPLTRASENGARLLLTADRGRTLFLSGRGASPEGDRPFLDKLDLESGETTRLWRSEAPYYEQLEDALDETCSKILTRRESVEETPNYFVRDLDAGTLTALTEFPHPMPQMLGVKKELVTYKRDDGVELSATLYLPPGYDPSQGPLPMLMWAYPREFKSAAAASQVSGSPYSFVRISPTSDLLFLARGYAVLDGPTMPIIGEGDNEPNDTYVKQLVASAKAAVDEMVRRGIADPKKIAIGGHSYGAFMVANLLTNSDLFAAGIARSGAYNRTLTPFGFQAEERTFWQAPEVYFTMSPFMHVPQMNEPLLLIHGEADNNSGTFPLQSERYYNALKGHGATVRLVFLPLESHGYAARESIMHMLWESSRWLDKYVKGEEPNY